MMSTTDRLGKSEKVDVATLDPNKFYEPAVLRSMRAIPEKIRHSGTLCAASISGRAALTLLFRGVLANYLYPASHHVRSARQEHTETIEVERAVICYCKGVVLTAEERAALIMNALRKINLE